MGVAWDSAMRMTFCVGSTWVASACWGGGSPILFHGHRFGGLLISSLEEGGELRKGLDSLVVGIRRGVCGKPCLDCFHDLFCGGRGRRPCIRGGRRLEGGEGSLHLPKLSLRAGNFQLRLL